MNTDEVEELKRRINSHADAFAGLASFARYQTNIPPGLDHEVYDKAMSAWFEEEGELILEKIDELGVYPKEYSAKFAMPVNTSAQRFLTTVAMLTISELKRVLPKSVFCYILSQAIEPMTLHAALDLQNRNN